MFDKLKKNWKWYFDKIFRRRKFTCHKCNMNKTCKYAFDWYNIYGDCIMEK